MTEPAPEKGWSYYLCRDCGAKMCSRCNGHLEWRDAAGWFHIPPCIVRTTKHDPKPYLAKVLPQAKAIEETKQLS